MIDIGLASIVQRNPAPKQTWKREDPAYLPQVQAAIPRLRVAILFGE